VQTSKFYQIFARKIEFYPQKRLIRQFLRTILDYHIINYYQWT